MNKGDYIKIGYISKIHGLKGGVVAMLNADFTLLELKSVMIEKNGALIPHFIENISDRGDKAFIKFNQVGSVDEATKLKGASIYLEKNLRPKLQKGKFYNDEIIGFELIDQNLGVIGSVKEIISSGPSELIVVETNAAKEYLIPLNAPFITSISKTKRKLLVDLPAGLLDI